MKRRPRPVLDKDKTVVFDIDGVLADASHRLHHLRKSPRDWRSFFADAAKDPVKTEVLRKLIEERQYASITLMTSRPHNLAESTMRWIHESGIPDCRVEFRRSTDHRSSERVKEDILARLGGPSRVARVYEDDEGVIDHLRSLGYCVIKVD